MDDARRQELLSAIEDECCAAIPSKPSSFTMEQRANRAARLAARRDAVLDRLRKNEIDGIRDVDANFLGKVGTIYSHAISLIYDGPPPTPRSAVDSPVYAPIDSAERPDDAPMALSLMDGRRSLDDIAAMLWSALPFDRKDADDSLDDIRRDLMESASDLERRGLVRKMERRMHTRQSLLDDLRKAGVAPGDAVMVHASVKSLGVVDGGAAAFIGALQDAVTEDGILAMPALSDTVDDGMGYEYDPGTTPPVKWIGVLPRIFWKSTGVVRSACPTHSVLAWGRDAGNFILQENPYDCFAPDGPWARLRDRNGKILLVGSSSVDSNTFLHACESWYATYMESVMVRVLGSGTHAEINYPGGCRGGWYHLGRKAPYFKMLQRDGLVLDARIGDSDVVVLESGRLAEAMKSYLADDPALLLHKTGCGVCAKTRSRIASTM